MEELKQIFEDLRAAGIVRTKKEFSDALGINYTGLIAAMGGQRVSPSLVAKAIRFRNEHLEGSGPSQPNSKVRVTKGKMMGAEYLYFHTDGYAGYSQIDKGSFKKLRKWAAGLE